MTYDEARDTIPASFFYSNSKDASAITDLTTLEGDNGILAQIFAKVKGTNYEHYNWVQIVTTNYPQPDSGNPANKPFVDPGDGSPYYFSPVGQNDKESDQNARERMAAEYGYSTEFKDQPWKTTSKGSI